VHGDHGWTLPPGWQGHVIVVRRDDPGEGELVAGDGELDDRPLWVSLRSYDTDHDL